VAARLSCYPTSEYSHAIKCVLKTLFVCSANRWRSPTAEKVFAAHAGIDVRSRGLSRAARRRLKGADLEWADVILVMEDDHHDRLLEHHRDALQSKPVHVLDIPDEYRFMAPELVEMLEVAVTPILEAHLAKRG